MKGNIRWGILGPGRIAKKFVAALRRAEGAELVAVASRSAASAEAFATEFSIPLHHGAYEALAADPGVDAIYVATPHPFHLPCAKLCLEAGKAVLCEKPLAVNADEVRALVALARARKVFLMEGMWSRFIPAVVRAKEWLAEGLIGEPRYLTADFGFRAPFDPKGRVYNPDLAGGALLDVGVYPVSLAHWLLGKPAQIVATAHLGPTGVDHENAVVFKYANGAQAVLSSAVSAVTIHEAFLSGTKGEIRIHPAWWCSDRVTRLDNGKELESCQLPQRHFAHEIEHVGTCLREGRTESPVMPLDESLRISESLDAIRAQWGLVYPFER